MTWMAFNLLSTQNKWGPRVNSNKSRLCSAPFESANLSACPKGSVHGGAAPRGGSSPLRGRNDVDDENDGRPLVQLQIIQTAAVGYRMHERFLDTATLQATGFLGSLAAA